MALEERDPLTGYATTGHEWNGIKELNTPVPRIIYFFLLATTMYGIIYAIFMPAVPLGRTYTKGLLGYDERDVVRADLERAASEQAAWREVIVREDFSFIQSDARVMTNVREAGRAMFGQNCAVCHGVDARGNRGFPDLAAGVLNWGDAPHRIQETLRVGINSIHPETRTAQMPAFGKDGLLPREDIKAVAEYVRALETTGLDGAAEAYPKGANVFATHCVACHGEKAEGNADLGAPNLTDDKWLYGSSMQAVHDTLWKGRQGHMPSWEDRLGPANIKILAVYLTDLRTAQP